MKKILFCIIGCFIVLPLGADNVTTTKPYVDYHVGQKQDKIPGYTPVEYIENTGGSYINTGVNGYGTWDIDAQGVTAPVGKNAILVAYYTNASAWFGAAPNNKWGFGSNSGTYFSDSFTNRVNVNLEFASKRATATINGVTINRTSTNTYTLNNYQLMDYKSSYPMVAKLYSAKFYNASGQLVFNGIPVRHGNECGLYDTVSGTFKSSPSGSFTCGPEGTGAILTYGATDGSIGSAIITDQIGTNTTESTIPTIGATVEALGHKMGTVGAGAGFVMAGEIVGGGTSTAHAKKPVYSSTNNYNDALVTATVVNNNARSAANNELSCLDNDCTLWQIGSAAQLDTTCKASDVPCINSDECCSNSCVLGQCFAACVPSGGLCTKTSQCCSGLQCLLNKCSALEKLCASDSDCSGLTPYCCNSKCQAKACATCAKEGELCGSTPCCAGLTCHAGKPSVCILTKS